MTAYTITPVGPNGPIKGLSKRVVGWDLRLLEENERLRNELDEARRVAAGAQRLSQRLDNESRLRVTSQVRLHRVARALACLSEAHPELRESIELARLEIWGDGDV